MTDNTGTTVNHYGADGLLSGSDFPNGASVAYLRDFPEPHTPTIARVVPMNLTRARLLGCEPFSRNEEQNPWGHTLIAPWKAQREGLAHGVETLYRNSVGEL